MRMVCNREGLLSACQLASVAVASRDVKPILKNIKAVVQPERCTLMATDMELGIRLEVRSVKVDEPGEAILPAARLLAILRESTDEELAIEATNDGSVVRGDNIEFEMPGEDPAHFPDFAEFAEERYHELAAGMLREMIRRTIFAAATSEHAKFNTTGVLCELEDEQARLVATDGRRLALSIGSATPHGGHTTKGQMPVVPTKAMSLLERNLQEPDEQVRISLRPNEVLMKTDRAMIYSRLIEGRYPDYRRVIPSKQSVKVALEVGPFQTAIRQAAIMTDEESKRVVFSFGKNKLTLKAQGSESGRSRVEMPLDYSGQPIDIGFDPKYLLEMLRVLPPETPLSLELIDPSSPVVLRTDASYTYVVVPLV
jgi:DNA polymerase III subunit beta